MSIRKDRYSKHSWNLLGLHTKYTYGISYYNQRDSIYTVASLQYNTRLVPSIDSNFSDDGAIFAIHQEPEIWEQIAKPYLIWMIDYVKG